MKNQPPLSSMPRDDAEPNPTKSGWFAPRSPTSFGGPIARKSNPHPRPRLEPQHRWRRGPCPHLDVRSPGRLSGPARLQLPHLSPGRREFVLEQRVEGVGRRGTAPPLPGPRTRHLTCPILNPTPRSGVGSWGQALTRTATLMSTPATRRSIRCFPHPLRSRLAL